MTLGFISTTKKNSLPKKKEITCSSEQNETNIKNDLFKQSFSVYFIILISSILRFIIPYNNVLIFSTITNLAFLLPIFIYIPFKNDCIMPGLIVVLTLQFSGSFAHHVRNCKNNTYRTFDMFGYLVFYIYIAFMCIWKFINFENVFHKHIFRYIVILIISFWVIFYENIKKHEFIILITTAACTTPIIIYKLFKNTEITFKVFGSYSIIIVLLYLCAYLLNKESDVWEANDKHSILIYEMTHGLWHIFVAHAQFIIVFITLNPYISYTLEPIAMGVIISLTILLTVIYYNNVPNNIPMFIISLFGTIFCIILNKQAIYSEILYFYNNPPLQLFWNKIHMHKTTLPTTRVDPVSGVFTP